MPLVDVAFAAGFGSLRQFNDTMRQELGVAPGLSARRRGATGAGSARRRRHDGGVEPAMGSGRAPAVRAAGSRFASPAGSRSRPRP